MLVYQDMLAMYANMKPKFVKQFAQVGKEMNEACTAYKNAVEEGSFPGDEHTFKTVSYTHLDVYKRQL